MNKISKNEKGFSSVELVIVIIVVALISVVGYLVYQNKHTVTIKVDTSSASMKEVQINARDHNRLSDMSYIQTQLEAFFSQNGNYPSRTDMNNATWLSKNMQSLDSASLADPSNKTIKTLVASPKAGAYAYAPLNSAGTSCETDDTTCATYTLTATYEGTVNGNSTNVKKNLD